MRAVDDISFTVAPGEVVGFLGPNGAGKTTTLKMLSGLIHPSSGDVRVLGYQPFRRERAYLRRMTMVMGNKSQLQWDLPAGDYFLVNKVIYRLPEREFRSGLAEVAKHGIVLEAEYFAELERDVKRLLTRELGVLERIIGGSCRLKASVVERDERESELRHVLNYGHTIGHALEAATGYARFAHGEAVSLGIVAEARLARRLGIADDETVARQERLLEALGLPIRAGALDVEPVVGAIARDKKAKDGRVPFVLAPRIGAFRLVYDVPVADVRAVIASLES